MQTKSSYGVMKWALFAGIAASLASACVVSEGDGNDNDTDITEGGDGGTGSSTAGSSNQGGEPTSAGGTGSDAGSPGMTDGGEPAMNMGGMPSTFEPGMCQEDEPITPTVEPSCDPVDGDDDCTACLKNKLCTEYKACFGEEPRTACGFGQMEGADGQFACISKCFADNDAGEVDPDMLLADCTVACDDCGTGLPNDETNDLITEANKVETCQAECFPF